MTDSMELYQELRRHMKGEVYFDRITTQLYATDASMYQIDPMGVVLPRHEEDMQAAVEAARKFMVPLVPRGGGTSLAGQSIGAGLIIDGSSHMNKILELDVEESWVRVEPGVVQDDLNRFLAPYGFCFGPDTSTSNRATIGGMVGNNSSGARSPIYGKTVDHIIEVESILSDGSWVTFRQLDEEELQYKLEEQTLEGHIYREVCRIIKENRTEIEERFPKIQRRVSGYNLDEMIATPTPNLAKLLVGSEGTLALSRALRMKIVPLPKSKGLLVAQFEDMIQAVEANGAILAHGPSAVELVDKRIMEEALSSPVFKGRTGFLQGRPGAIMIVEFFGDSSAEVNDKLEKLEDDLKRNKMGYAHVRAVEPADQAQVWNLRKGGLGLLMGTRSEAKPVAFVEDAAVDPLKLPGFLRAFEKIINKHGTTAGYYGHSSVGLLHIRPFLDLKQPGERRKMMAIFEEVTALVEEYGGAISGEHGDGLARSWLLERLFGSKLAGAFGDVKGAFDPGGLMNPGKIVKAPEPTENLRLGDSYSGTKLETVLDFSRDGGFNFAVEMCNGNGQCRKTDTGVMCPSFQATRCDRDSTRGRANALRSFISGKINKEEFTGPEMFSVMDLCIECKGCRSECPSKVDMAKMKYEFLYHYYKENRIPRRVKMLGDVAKLARLGSLAWPLSNWLPSNIFSKMILRALGITPMRRMPKWAPQRFSAWFARWRVARAAAEGTDGTPAPGRPRVVLFHDTFMEYYQPTLGKDAVELLVRAGYEPILVARKCCGRSMISKGLLDKARKNARYNVDLLKEYAADGVPIVGVEPSCILTIKEEYRDLLPGEDTDLVASQTFTIDEFLARLYSDGSLAPPRGREGEEEKEILVHAHCHQKALTGTSATLEVLRNMPGVKVSEIDSGCCGMAGSFGYEWEHYTVSMNIGEQRLFPAVRGAGEKTELVADGFSCREQIAHGTKRKARHLVEIIAEAYRDEEKS